MLALATWRVETAASCTAEPERVGNAALDGFLGERTVEGDGAAGEPVADPAEDDVGVGVGGLHTALAVTGRPRRRACRLRPVAERFRRVDPGERAAAGANGQHLDAGEADRIAVLHVPVGGHPQIAPVAERDIGAGAAHVEADGVLVARELGDEAARDGPRRDARGGEPGRELGRRFLGHHAAAGVQQQDVLVVAAFAKAGGETRHVVAGDRGEHRIGDRGREALVFEDLGHDFAGERDRRAGDLLLQDVAHAPLVFGVGEGVGEANGDRLHAALVDDAGGLARLGLVHRLDDRAAVVDAFGDDQAVAALDVGRRHLLVGVPEIVAGCRGESRSHRGSPWW